MNTKQRIVIEALHLFSKYGYDAVSVAQIGEAVGIKAPSLYKHYKSKQEIFQAIIDEMGQRYNEQMQEMMLHGTDPEIDKKAYVEIDENQLIAMGKVIFQFYLHDEVSSQFRRLITVEQYRNADLAALYKTQYFDAPIAYQSQIFAYFMQEGTMRQGNPQIVALHFYAPLFFLLMLCDCDKTKEEVIMEQVEEHVRQFHSLYTLKKEEQK